MSYSYANADPQRETGEVIPHGTLAWAILNVRPHNDTMGLIEVPSKNKPENKYLDIDLVIVGGPYDKRHVFEMIGVQGGEQYVNIGRSAIKAILETGRGAGPQNLALYELQAGQDAQGKMRVNFMELDQLKVAIKIKVENGGANPAGGTYPDKNRVALWLSPLDPAAKKDWDRLLAGDTAAPTAASSPTPQQQLPWGPPATSAPAPAPTAAPAPQGTTGKPAWL